MAIKESFLSIDNQHNSVAASNIINQGNTLWSSVASPIAIKTVICLAGQDGNFNCILDHDNYSSFAASVNSYVNGLPLGVKNGTSNIFLTY